MDLDLTRTVTKLSDGRELIYYDETPGQDRSAADERDLPTVSTAVAAGAHGARMTGGGFGGSAIALVDRDQLDAVRTAVLAAFAEHGYTEPQFFPAVASAGARRIA